MGLAGAEDDVLKQNHVQKGERVERCELGKIRKKKEIVLPIKLSGMATDVTL
jgi:hypothetical protein